MQSTISLRIDSLRLLRIRMTNGFKISFWNVKLASSARSKYFIPSCLKESIAYIAIFSSGWLPAEIKWLARTDHILAHTWKEHYRFNVTRKNPQYIMKCYMQTICISSMSRLSAYRITSAHFHHQEVPRIGMSLEIDALNGTLQLTCSPLQGCKFFLFS